MRINREAIDNLAEEVEMLMKMQGLNGSNATDFNQEGINSNEDAFYLQKYPLRRQHAQLPLHEI